MARPREPINLIEAKGRSHLTKAEIEERRAVEVQPCTDEIEAPGFLTAAQKKHFLKLAGQLEKIRIMGETDVDTLARYVTAQSQYEKTTKELRALAKDKPKRDEPDYYTQLDLWYAAQNSAAKLQDRYFKQASALARDLGLTISSRCKLVVPAKDEEPKVNKFAQFRKAAGGE